MDEIVALLDANVLWPITLCDVLLYLAEDGLYRPVWSATILAETLRTLKAWAEKRHPGHDLSGFDKRVADMERAFPDAMVQDYERWIPAMETRDPDDQHVLAAAVQAGATMLVTENARDFPEHVCARHGIDVLGVDDFLCLLWKRDTTATVAALSRCAGDKRNPPMTVRRLLEKLERVAPTFVQRVGPSSGA